MNPGVSVIMSVYKEPIDWIKQSVESILNQTYKNFEYIIICDNPDYKEAISLLKSYERNEPRIKIITNKENIGLTKSLNKGIRISNGKYIARLDADDVSLPMRLEKQYNYMQSNKDIIVLGTNVKCIGEKSLIHQGPSIFYEDEDLKAQLLLQNCFVHSSVFIRKEILEANGIIYDEDYRQTQDLRLWEILMQYGKFANLRDKLVLYRFSNQQITKSNGTRQMDNSKKIRFRMQMAWLLKIGYDYSITDIENCSYYILMQLKKNKDVRKTKEFKAFIQYVYLNSNERRRFKFLSFLADIKYFSFSNALRVFRLFLS